MFIVTAPQVIPAHLEHNPLIFLAGGISNCEDWQSKALEMLSSEESPMPTFGVLNPRRPNFNECEVIKQIQWEWLHFQKACAAIFWFPKETLCPITLFEYGKWLMTSNPVFVGTDPDYERRLDIVEQTRLENKEVVVFDQIESVINSAIRWVRTGCGN